ncbi:MAG: transcription-repair coupling factor [Acidimicrobiia bacterium]
MTDRVPAAGHAPLAALAGTLAHHRALADALGARNAAVAVPDHARALSIAGLSGRVDGELVLVVVPSGADAAVLRDDLAAYLGDRDVALLPAWETLPFERVSPSVETMSRRLEVAWRLRADRPRVLVTGVRALLQKCAPDDADPIRVVKGGTVDPDELAARLVAYGYRREDVVEHRGEFARRGSIVDVYPGTADAPVRIDLWGDEVDRLAEFDPDDQRSTREIAEAVVFPARELRLDDGARTRARALTRSEPWGREQWERLAEGQTFDGMESWMPWVVDAPRLVTDVAAAHGPVHVVVCEPRRVRDRGAELIAEEDDLARALASTWSRDPERPFPHLHADVEGLLASVPARTLVAMHAAAAGPAMARVECGSWGAPTNDLEAVAVRARRLLADDGRMVVAADTEASAARFAEVMREQGFVARRPDEDGTSVAEPGLSVVVAPLSRGCVLEEERLAVVAEPDLTGRRRTRRPPRAARRGAGAGWEDLAIGGHVVHQVHGIGRYLGMVTRAMGGVERDYLHLQYANGTIYVPTDHLDAVRQYAGGDAPALHRMGGADFARSKARVRSAVREVAQELVVLYQRRVRAPGHAFGVDTAWQGEMEGAFPWVETPDQRRAIEETKADMERAVPMDRLVCGDVGFGKTEVAVRAAFKCVQDGKQVAVLVPTTLLAAQHGATFASRFAGYPVRVATLSRFNTAAESRDVLKGLADGSVDCVIGTHRLLQDDVRFRDLGLLVVDEEQRFGVQHKERMKRLRTDVDVLTLSATPIPRTLEMSLVGIRDLSLLQTPPADRQPILTFVGEYDERVAVEAIRRERLRDGQVFWVHHRVQTIEDRAEELRRLVPEARIAVAHGQMDEARLERVVVDFWEGAYDVLVCTTIIESGIDMPAVNTLVVERADLLGLGQLHQLRGRVGRSGQRAYAYLFHPRDRSLTEEAHERLRTIGESTELGSGFRIAMRDLEIRGTGHLLGEAQSGHIASVGYDLYCQLVTEAVAEMKGEVATAPADLVLDVPTSAYLPADYVPREDQRLDAYRRLVGVTTHAQVEDLRREWADRFGPPPPAAEALLDVGALRAECHRLGVREVSVSDGVAAVTPIDLRASVRMRLARTMPSATHDERARRLTARLPRDVAPARAVLALLRDVAPPDDADAASHN